MLTLILLGFIIAKTVNIAEGYYLLLMVVLAVELQTISKAHEKKKRRMGETEKKLNLILEKLESKTNQ